MLDIIFGLQLARSIEYGERIHRFIVIAVVCYASWKLVFRYVDLDELMKHYAKESQEDRRRRGYYVLLFSISPIIALPLTAWLGFVQYPSIGLG
jgi:predicted Abi (CAAX) family protease